MAARRTRRKFGHSQKERIFFACVPNNALAVKIHTTVERLKRDKGLEAALILPEHLHVALFHLGDWQILPEDIINLASGAASQIDTPAFEVTFQRAESFRNSTGVHPFVLTTEAPPWRKLHESLGAALKDAGLGAATRGKFKPHMTLTYDRQRVSPFAISPITWTVRDFVLIHSKLGKTTHIHLGRWPLSS